MGADETHRLRRRRGHSVDRLGTLGPGGVCGTERWPTIFESDSDSKGIKVERG